MVNSSSRGKGVEYLSEAGTSSSQTRSGRDVVRSTYNEKEQQALDKVKCCKEMESWQEKASQSQAIADEYRKEVVKALKDITHLTEEQKKDARELDNEVKKTIEIKKEFIVFRNMQIGELKETMLSYIRGKEMLHKERIKCLTEKLNPYYVPKLKYHLTDAILYQELADEEQQFANRAKSNIEKGQFGERLTYALDHYPTPNHAAFGSVPNLLERAIYNCFIGGLSKKELQVGSGELWTDMGRRDLSKK